MRKLSPKIEAAYKVFHFLILKSGKNSLLSGKCREKVREFWFASPEQHWSNHQWPALVWLLDNSDSTGALSTRPASAADWFNKGRTMCYHGYMIMHVKSLSICRKSRALCLGSRLLYFPVHIACFVWNMNVNVIQSVLSILSYFYISNCNVKPKGLPKLYVCICVLTLLHKEICTLRCDSLEPSELWSVTGDHCLLPK